MYCLQRPVFVETADKLPASHSSFSECSNFVETADGRRTSAVYRRGEAAPSTSSSRAPGLQVPPATTSTAALHHRHGQSSINHVPELPELQNFHGSYIWILLTSSFFFVRLTTSREALARVDECPQFLDHDTLVIRMTTFCLRSTASHTATTSRRPNSHQPGTCRAAEVGNLQAVYNKCRSESDSSLSWTEISIRSTASPGVCEL